MCWRREGCSPRDVLTRSSPTRRWRQPIWEASHEREQTSPGAARRACRLWRPANFAWGQFERPEGREAGGGRAEWIRQVDLDEDGGRPVATPIRADPA